MANDERDANHIWLRQSVRFSEGGRERTIEIALPLPLGATPPEVERLLAEADAGMARLSQHLERQVATALRDGTTAPAAAFASTTPAATPAAAGNVPAPAPSAPARAAAPLAPLGEGLGVRTPPPASRIAESSAMPPAAPARAAAPLAVPAEGPEVKTALTRPEFLAETRALGLTPPQVMERLGVRTLDGLNLREALDMLRRQVGGSALPAPEPQAPSAATNGAAPASPRAAASASPVVFDEEEEFELVVLGPDMQTEDYGAELPYGDDAALDSTAAPDALDALDALDEDGDDGALDDVPDLGDMLPPAPEPARPSAGSAFTPAQKARARELVAAFRAVTAGGSPARSQHTAFANVVADQLSAATAATLVRGLWGQPPERLGTDQLDAVIRWGKQDEFAEEAPVVLALLRAEQARQAGASTAAAAPPAPASDEPTSDAPAPRAPRAARKPASGEGRS
jgi:hypothetical protein